LNENTTHFLIFLLCRDATASPIVSVVCFRIFFSFFLGVERKKMKCSKTRDNSTKNVEYHGQVICLMHLTSFFFFFKLKLFDLLEPGGGIFWPDCPQLE
jgi:hypothetical protein